MCIECTRQYRESWTRLPNGQYLYTMEVYVQGEFEKDEEVFWTPMRFGWRTVVEQAVDANFVLVNQLQGGKYNGGDEGFDLPWSTAADQPGTEGDG